MWQWSIHAPGNNLAETPGFCRAVSKGSNVPVYTKNLLMRVKLTLRPSFRLSPEGGAKAILMK